MTDWQKVAEIITRHQRFVVTTHVNPDGDGLGSQVALGDYLSTLGKEAHLINPDPVPFRYRFLDPHREILVYPHDGTPELIQQAEVILMVDNSGWERLGPLKLVVKEAHCLRVTIDHHASNGGFSEVNLLRPGASATGEIIYDLIREMGGTLTPRIAEGLYVAILTDTGSFRYSNTTSRVHRIAADLLAIGIDLHHIHQEIYGREREARFRLLAQALAQLRVECGGRLAWFTITQEMLRASGATYEDVEGFPELPRTIQGVEMVLLFKEMEDARVKVSLRSNARVDVNQFANQFGGGGHPQAAGILTAGPFDSTVQQVVQRAREYLANADERAGHQMTSPPE